MKKRKKGLKTHIICMFLCMALCLQLFTVIYASNDMGLSTELGSCTYSDGVINTSVNITNNDNMAQTLYLIAAVTDTASSKLLAVNLKQIVVPASKHNYAIQVPCENLGEDYTVSVYFWEDLANLEPIANSLTYQHTAYNDQFELKDIEKVQVYKLEDGKSVACDYLNPAEITDYTNYVVEIQMRDMPITYAGIKSCTLDGEEVSLELENENLMSYGPDMQAQVSRVRYPAKAIADLTELIAQIKENPSGTFTLDRDYDASKVPISRSAVANSSEVAAVQLIFTGKLNGNGHTIYNLTQPLFHKTSNAAINDLVIKNASMNIENVGYTAALMRVCDSTAITNVHVNGLYTYAISGPDNGVRLSGGIAGDVYGTSIIKNCSVTDFHLKGRGVNSGGLFGGIAGRVVAASIIEDCFVSGKITDIGNKGYANTCVGGLVGLFGRANNDSPQIRRCVANVENASSTPSESGGLIGYTFPGCRSRVSVTDCFAAGNTPSGYRFVGVAEDNSTQTLSFIKNSFELDTAKGISNINTENGGQISSVTSAEHHTAAFYQDRLHLSTESWDFSFLPITGMPYPGSLFPKDTIKTPQEPGTYIPNLDMVRLLPGYAAGNSIAYSNAYKLMPFQNSETLIREGNKIAASGGVLKERNVRHVLPLTDGKYQSAITTENYQNINEIMVFFTDGTSECLAVHTPATQGGVAQYTLAEYGAAYAFENYIVDVDTPLVKELVAQVAAVQYENSEATGTLLSLVGGRHIDTNTYKMAADLANKKAADLTSGGDFIGTQWTEKNDLNRLDETYNELIAQPEKFVYGLLSSKESLYPGTSSVAAAEKFKKSIEQNLTQMIYSYLYIQRWYDIDIGTVNLADLMYFDSNFYGGAGGFENISNAVVGASRDQRRGNSTNNMYANRLVSIYNEANVSAFVEKNIRIFTDENDSSQWFREFYKGPLEERQVESSDGSRRSRSAWENLIKDQNRILPMLTLENDPVRGKDLYVVSYAHTFHYGVVSAYAEDYSDPTQYEKATKLVKEYADAWGTMFSITPSFVEDAESTLLSNYFESRDSAYLAKYKTASGTLPERIPACDPKASPAFRDFASVILTMQASNGHSAWASGTLMNAECAQALGGSLAVQTHENAHNTASKYFYGGHPNRMGSEGETNSILAQYNDGLYVNTFSLNLMAEFPATSEYTGSLTYKRFDGMTPDGKMTNIQDFYRKYFEALYTLDILESRALLSLDKETQRKLMFQHSYTNNVEGAAQTANTKRDSTWNQVATQDAYDALNIQDYTDMMKHHMNITRDIYKGVSYVGAGDYNFSCPFSTFIWEPYNDMGRADKMTAKKMPYELLGESGWQYGFANYLSNTGTEGNNNNDLGALRVAMKHTDLLDEPAAIASGANLDPDTMNYEDWKLARYKVVEEKLNTTTSPYFDAQEIENAYRAAFLADANFYNGKIPVGSPNATAESKPFSAGIRINALRYLLRMTDNFQTSIYEPDSDVITITTAQEFVTKVTENPRGNFRLASDLDFSEVTAPANANAYITVPEFMGRVNGDDGNGGCYTIRNTTLPLFKNVMYGHVENIRFDNVNINMPSANIATVALNSNKGYFSNLHVTNSTLTGNCVGGIVCVDFNSTSSNEGINMVSSIFSGISVNATINGKNTSGGIVAAGSGSFIGNNYTRGDFNVSGGNRGGIIGESNFSGISQCYSAFNWKNGGAGVLGNSSNAIRTDLITGSGVLRVVYPTVVNSIGVNTGGNASRFYSGDKGRLATGFVNNYEYENAPGSTNIGGNSILSATESDLENLEFYTKTLQFSDVIWDMSGVYAGMLPTLRNADPNSGLPLPSALVQEN